MRMRVREIDIFEWTHSLRSITSGKRIPITMADYDFTRLLDLAGDPEFFVLSRSDYLKCVKPDSDLWWGERSFPALGNCTRCRRMGPHGVKCEHCLGKATDWKHDPVFNTHYLFHMTDYVNRLWNPKVLARWYQVADERQAGEPQEMYPGQVRYVGEAYPWGFPYDSLCFPPPAYMDEAGGNREVARKRFNDDIDFIRSGGTANH